MLTLNDLQALDAAAFNRAIAEADGWEIEYEGAADFGQHYWWFRRDGDERMVNAGADPDEAWRVAYELDECGRTTLPDYAHDLNAAWALCAALPMAVVDVRFFAAQRGGYVQISPCDGLQIDFEGQPARALSTAWYAWLLDQRERKE